MGAGGYGSRLKAGTTWCEFGAPLTGSSNRLEFPIGKPHHLQQQPAVAEARDLGLAESAGLVVDRRLDDFQILFGRTEDQIEIAERVESPKVVPLARQRLIIPPQQNLGAA